VLSNTWTSFNKLSDLIPQYWQEYILLKHASIVPQCAIAIENLFAEQLPEGLYTNLMISGKEVLH
jgi:hypothetical protein